MTSPAESRVRARTRQAILDAGVTVLGRDPAATLGDVARAAGVGRTTLHRYFPERPALVEALSVHALERVTGTLGAAAADGRPGRAALLRLCRDLFDLGDVLSLAFGPLLADRPEWSDTGEAAAPVLDLVARGHADGTVEPSLTPVWIQSLLWSVLYAAHALDPVGGSRHDALAQAVRSLDGALRPMR